MAARLLMPLDRAIARLSAVAVLLFCLLACCPLVACQSQLLFPITSAHGMAFDLDGYLWFADNSSSRLVQSNSVSGSTQGLAGFLVRSPAMGDPSSMTFDPSGTKLFVTDGGLGAAGGRVDIFNVSSGALLRSFSTSSPTMRRPTGVSLTAGGALLWVCDTGNNRVLAFDVATGVLNSTFTTSQPALNAPQGVVVDSLRGGMWVSDTGNSRVLRVSAAGSVTLVVNSTSPSLSSPTGLAMDVNGHLFVANRGSQCVLQLDGDTGATVRYFFTTNPTLAGITAVVVSSDLRLFVADTAANRVVVFDVSASAASHNALYTFSTKQWSASVNYLCAVTVGQSGLLYIADYSAVIVANSAGIEQLVFPVTSACATGIQSVAVDPTESWVIALCTNWGSHEASILQMSVTTGAYIASFGTTVDCSYGCSMVPSIDPSGNSIWWAGGSTVYQVSVSTGAVLATFSGTWGGINNVAFDADGYIYLCDRDNAAAYKMDSVGVVSVGYYVPNAIQYTAPTQVLVDSAGFVYLMDNYLGLLHFFTNQGAHFYSLANVPPFLQSSLNANGDLVLQVSRAQAVVVVPITGVVPFPPLVSSSSSSSSSGAGGTGSGGTAGSSLPFSSGIGSSGSSLTSIVSPAQTSPTAPTSELHASSSSSVSFAHTSTSFASSSSVSFVGGITSSGHSSSTLSTAAIIGIAAGGGAALLLCCLLALLACACRKPKNASAAAAAGASNRPADGDELPPEYDHSMPSPYSAQPAKAPFSAPIKVATVGGEDEKETAVLDWTSKTATPRKVNGRAASASQYDMTSVEGVELAGMESVYEGEGVTSTRA